MAYVETGYVAAGYVEADAPATGYPSPSDVRLGVVYGPASEYTGTYQGSITWPSAQDIAQGVLALLLTAAIPVNLVQVKGQTINGAGTESNPWGP